MEQETRLDEALRQLGRRPPGPVPDGFMDGVWLRAGEMAEAANARRRLALFAVIFIAGLSGGIGAVGALAQAEPPFDQTFTGANLSPAVLLHVQS